MVRPGPVESRPELPIEQGAVPRERPFEGKTAKLPRQVLRWAELRVERLVTVGEQEELGPSRRLPLPWVLCQQPLVAQVECTREMGRRRLLVKIDLHGFATNFAQLRRGHQPRTERSAIVAPRRQCT